VKGKPLSLPHQISINSKKTPTAYVSPGGAAHAFRIQRKTLLTASTVETAYWRWGSYVVCCCANSSWNNAPAGGKIAPQRFWAGFILCDSNQLISALLDQLWDRGIGAGGKLPSFIARLAFFFFECISNKSALTFIKLG